MAAPSHLILVLLLALFQTCSYALPLSTNKRWIVDAATGKRVKLACVNWAGHLEPMVPEGLNKKPLKEIVSQIRETGFNCVRLTYATYTFTRHAGDRVGDTFESLDIPEVTSKISNYNPSILNMTHVQVYDAVIDELGAQGLMVDLDNHVGMPKWCCNDDDENGFWGDRHMQPDEWLQALNFVASHFKEKPAVVAMSLHNELHGPHQNLRDWYSYVSLGATTIHKAAPDFLVLVSSLNYDTDFTFLKKKPLHLNLDHKLVYETHLYSWSQADRYVKLKDVWTAQPVDRVCATFIQSLKDRNAFLMEGDNAAPMFVSEFGFDQTFSSEDDTSNKFLTCMLSYLANEDLDWALWAYPGSYYYREGKPEVEDVFGVVDADWKNLRYPEFPQRFQLAQKMVRGPSSNASEAYIMYHPQSGLCIQVNGTELEATNCDNPSKWGLHGDKLRLLDNSLCLNAASEGLPPTMSHQCSSEQSTWEFRRPRGLHYLATLDTQGQYLCMNMESSSNSSSKRILMNKCVCMDHDTSCLDNPQSQWFQLVPSNIYS